MFGFEGVVTIEYIKITGFGADFVVVIVMQSAALHLLCALHVCSRGVGRGSTELNEYVFIWGVCDEKKNTFYLIFCPNGTPFF